MLEKDVKRECKKLLKKAKWIWIDTSAPTRALSGMKDAPDTIFIRWNQVVFIEFKRPGGTPTVGQWEWRGKIGPHLGRHVHHMFIYHSDQLPPWMLDIEDKV